MRTMKRNGNGNLEATKKGKEKGLRGMKREGGRFWGVKVDCNEKKEERGKSTAKKYFNRV